MTEFPVPLDNLIAYVKALPPGRRAAGERVRRVRRLHPARRAGRRANRLLRRPGPQVRPVLEPDRRRHGRLQAGRAEALRADQGRRPDPPGCRQAVLPLHRAGGARPRLAPPRAAAGTGPQRGRRPVGAAHLRRGPAHRAGGRGREGHRRGGPDPRAGLREHSASARHPQRTNVAIGRAARPELRRSRQGGAQGRAEVRACASGTTTSAPSTSCSACCSRAAR